MDTFVADFGAYDRAILDFVFAKNPITGWTYGAARLPFELPSSDAAVDAQYEDVPADSLAPTYALGTRARTCRRTSAKRHGARAGGRCAPGLEPPEELSGPRV